MTNISNNRNWINSFSTSQCVYRTNRMNKRTERFSSSFCCCNCCCLFVQDVCWEEKSYTFFQNENASSTCANRQSSFIYIYWNISISNRFIEHFYLFRFTLILFFSSKCVFVSCACLCVCSLFWGHFFVCGALKAFFFFISARFNGKYDRRKINKIIKNMFHHSENKTLNLMEKMKAKWFNLHLNQSTKSLFTWFSKRFNHKIVLLIYFIFGNEILLFRPIKNFFM